MPRLFKIAVLYLSMLVIPAQGFAASTMLSCGPAHQHTKTAQGDANSFSAHHQSLPQAVASLDPVGHATGDEEVKFSSSEHAACAMGAAVPASSVRFQPAAHAIGRIALEQFMKFGFVTDGPIRPPRSFPA
jgi:hypothetical protein